MNENDARRPRPRDPDLGGWNGLGRPRDVPDRTAIDPERGLEPEASVDEQAAFATALDADAPASAESAGVLHDVEAPPATPQPARAGRATLRRTAIRDELPITSDRPTATLLFVGTATLVLRLGEFTILTDPNFVHKGRQVDLGYGMKSTRLTDPAIELGDLPPLDLALVSHLHGDHFDRLASAMLNRALPIVTNSRAAPSLNLLGFRDVQGLATWRSLDLRKGATRLRITAMPARHAPWPLSEVLPEVMGSLIDVSAGREHSLRLYISGDTVIHDRLRQIPRRYQNIDVAVLHLGGTRLAGVKLTMDANDGVECLRIVQPRATVPVHYDDYPVFRSPLSAFREAVDRAGLTNRVRYVARGDEVDLWELSDTVKAVAGAERLLPRDL